MGGCLTMEKKDLAEQYALKEYMYVNGKTNVVFEDSKCFTFDNIKDAFNAGCESIVEKASELEWKEIGVYGEDKRYFDVCRASKPLDEFLIREWPYPKDIELECNDAIHNGFKTIEEAKSYAKELYKQKVKQVLGL